MASSIEDCDFKLTRDHRGIGLIIVNKFNGQGEYQRAGADTEVENLGALFAKMGLDVTTHIELTLREMKDLLEKTSKDERLKTDSMIAVAISSHGSEQGIMGYDHGAIDSLSIRTYFNGIQCEALAKKPKIIILNGCRGTESEEIIEGDNIEQRNIPKQQATTWSDFFTIHSCQFGTESLRSRRGGSIFINVLKTAYDDYGQYPFELIMPIVNRKLIKLFETKDRRVKEKLIGQSCTWESSCTCVLKIPPVDAPTIVERVPTSVLAQPADDSFKLVWGTCTKGLQGPNQMSTPGGLITTPDGQIYITDSASTCIWVYTEDGDPMYQDIKPKTFKQLCIGNLGLTYCWGMCIKDNFLFVSCTLALIKFSLVGGGLLTHKFHDVPITGMDVDDKSTVYACERHSCKILKLDMELNVKPDKLDLTHTLDAANDRLMDIKVVNDELYVLVNKNAHTIQIFDKEGIHRRNLISNADLRECLFFTMNKTKKTIFAGDIVTNELKAFNANGELMYKTGCHGDRRGDLIEPSGIDLNDNGEVVIVSAKKSKFMLQCFKLPPNM